MNVFRPLLYTLAFVLVAVTSLFAIGTATASLAERAAINLDEDNGEGDYDIFIVDEASDDDEHDDEEDDDDDDDN
jgi:hypothetical protein